MEGTILPLITDKTPKRVVVSWSGGKDSAWTLHRLRQQPEKYLVLGLLTTINQTFNRIAMHGVRRELLEAQGEAAGLPLWTIPLPSPCTNEHYERRMTNALHFLKRLGIDAIAFGDLYLQDIRQYREAQFGTCGLELLFPVWGKPTRQLAEEMLRAGVKARLSCVDPKSIPPEWAGRDYDENLLSDLSPSVDPCAENGEFHTFVYSGPMFRSSIPIRNGETVRRDEFVFCDLLLATANAESEAATPVLAG
jgi:uncharacterized protein (TIGR00290 family)